MRKIFILLGHPDKETFSGALADEYERGARQSGHEIRRINIEDLKFDPILYKGYKIIQELEPDLIRVQQAITWADILVIIYPNWWITMPALLKGLFDRMILPGFAFHIDKKTHKVERLLCGKRARVIVVSGSQHPLMIIAFFGDFTNEITHGILGYCGVKPVRLTCLGPSERVSESKRKRWKKKIYKLGQKGI